MNGKDVNEENIDDGADEIFQDVAANYVYVNPDPDAAPVASNASSKSKDYGEQLVSNLEEKYQNMPATTEAAERAQEKEKLTVDLKKLTNKLKNVKNVKNFKVRAKTGGGAAERRKNIKAQIEQIKQKLYDLELEEQGSEVTSSALVDSTLKASLTTKESVPKWDSFEGPQTLPKWEGLYKTPGL